MENGENEKLSSEPKMRDASTSMSPEHLSLMIKYNQVGSLSSLSRGSKVDIFLKKTSVNPGPGSPLGFCGPPKHFPITPQTPPNYPQNIPRNTPIEDVSVTLQTDGLTIFFYRC